MRGGQALPSHPQHVELTGQMGFLELPQHLRFGAEVVHDGALGHPKLAGDITDIRSVVATFGDVADERVENLATSAGRSGHLKTFGLN